ncbi:uncharacterized protein BYT42DRAFT_611976 [Radiomyces spectabilis]|uniref:uncharacterized protein n=1 Tax=Radiomyces spectabilis TaxID=64574 RepID=UPI00221F4EDB|nr:uncharacterized protein BYT42DRAFT_611976 [Radiomyces spectabilis]KAI8384258.1 hypothetical protein BYT42DRAFT_611976 [Radiomyces spectabilis]
MKPYSLSLLASLLLSAFVSADIEYFQKPAQNTVYAIGSTATFAVDDMPNDEDHTVTASLYTEDGSFVKTIQTWKGSMIGDDNDHFKFNWQVESVPEGRYYVEILDLDEDDKEDAAHSYVFTVRGSQPAAAAAAAPATVQPVSSTVPMASDSPTPDDGMLQMPMEGQAPNDVIYPGDVHAQEMPASPKIQDPKPKPQPQEDDSLEIDEAQPQSDMPPSPDHANSMKDAKILNMPANTLISAQLAEIDPSDTTTTADPSSPVDETQVTEAQFLETDATNTTTTADSPSAADDANTNEVKGEAAPATEAESSDAASSPAPAEGEKDVGAEIVEAQEATPGNLLSKLTERDDPSDLLANLLKTASAPNATIFPMFNPALGPPGSVKKEEGGDDDDDDKKKKKKGGDDDDDDDDKKKKKKGGDDDDDDDKKKKGGDDDDDDKAKAKGGGDDDDDKPKKKTGGGGGKKKKHGRGRGRRRGKGRGKARGRGRRHGRRTVKAQAVETGPDTPSHAQQQHRGQPGQQMIPGDEFAMPSQPAAYTGYADFDVPVMYDTTSTENSINSSDDQITGEVQGAWHSTTNTQAPLTQANPEQQQAQPQSEALQPPQPAELHSAATDKKKKSKHKHKSHKAAKKLAETSEQTKQKRSLL